MKGDFRYIFGPRPIVWRHAVARNAFASALQLVGPAASSPVARTRQTEQVARAGGCGVILLDHLVGATAITASSDSRR
jgi:hypothetical protein